MKLAPMFLVLIVQAHASFFDEFQNAMSSLQNGIQKIITDVVTDVKDTIDCTVIAAESALSFGVIANNPQNAKCNRASDKFINIDRSKSDDNIKRLSLDFLRDKPFVDTHESSSLDENVSKQIDVSVSNVHRTLYDIVNKKDIKSDMQSHVSKWEENNILSDNNKPDFYPKSLKDLFDKSLPVTTGADNINKNLTEEKETSTENTSNSFKDTINDVDPLDYDSLFGDTLDKGEYYHKETLEQAKNLIKDSQHTDSILNSFFGEEDQSGANIFDN